VIVAEVRKLYGVAGSTLCRLGRSINMPLTVELAVEVRGPGHMDRPTVEMPFFSMPMIRFGMNMEQWYGKHP
jgi:hypothetical protein